jgi:hypothetical protein
MAENIDYNFFVNMFFNMASRARVGAESVLSKTRYGQGNLISIVDNPDGSFGFRLNATGEIFTNLVEAQSRSDKLYLTEFFSLTNQARHGDNMAYLSEIMGSVQQRAGTFTGNEKRILRAAGLESQAIDEIMGGYFSSSLVTLRVSENQRNKKADARKIADVLMSGELSGSPVFDDEGARLIQIQTDSGIKLNQLQIESLFRLAGHGTVAADEIFGQGGALESGTLLKSLQKVPKRLRGVMAPRDVSLSGDILSEALDGRTLQQSVYIFDENLYLFARQFGMESDAINAGILDQFMVDILNEKGLNTASIFQDFTSYLDEALAEGLIDQTQRNSSAFGRFEKRRLPGGRKGGKQKRQPLVRTFVDESNDRMSRIIQDSFRELFTEAGQGAHITGEMLRQKIEDRITQFGYDESITEIMKDYIFGMFDRNTKAFDGFSVWDSLFYERLDENISAEIVDLERSLPTMSPDQKKAAQERIRNLMNQKTSIGYALESNPEQHTIRAGITYGGKEYQIKSSTIPFALNAEMRQAGYVAVVSTADLKPEMSITGDVEGLNLSGLGRSRGIVYLDDPTGAFIGPYLQSGDSEDFMLRRFRDVQAQIKSFDETGALPNELISALKHEASRDIDILPTYARDSARRNRQYAQRLLDLYRSGIDVRSAPQLVNFVHNYMQVNAFRTEDGVLQVAMPGSYRFSALSEASSEIFTDGELLFGGNSSSSIPTRTRIEIASGQSAEVVNFRLKGHGLLFASQDIQKFHHVLGGFDLDDKTLIHYASYENVNNMKSFGFLMSRQPSGIEEVMFGKAVLDSHSANSIFGKRKDIMDQIVEMMNMQGTERVSRLSALSGISYSDQEAETIFQAIEDLFLLNRNRTTRQISENRNILGLLESSNPDVKNRISTTRLQMLQSLNTSGTVGEHVENLLANLYGGPTLSQDAMTLIQRGGSTLDVNMLNRSNPEFASFFVQRAMFNAGAGDMTEPLLESLSGFTDDNELRSIYSSLSSFVETKKLSGLDPDSIFIGFQKEIQSIYSGASASAKKMMEIALDSAFKTQTLLDSQKGGEILGQYVNRSMIAGNALGQVEELVGAIKGDSELQNFFGDHFKLRYAGQEEAIDAAVLMGRTAKAISTSAQSAATSQGAIRAIEQLYEPFLGGGTGSVVPEDLILKGLGSDDRGELLIRQIGRLMGAVSGVGSDRIKIDAGMLMSGVGSSPRLSDKDLSILMEEMLTGAKLFQDSLPNRAGANTTEVIRDLEEIIGLSSSDRDENIIARQREMFIEKFGIKEGKHAAVYSNRRLAETMARQSSGATGSIADMSLSYVSSNSKTERIAESIIQEHKNMLDRVRGLADSKVGENSDAIFREMSKLNVSESLYHSIAYAIDQHGVNILDLTNELDRAGFAAGVDILDLATVMTDDPGDRISDLIRSLEDARAFRQLTFATNTADFSVLEQMIARSVQYESLSSLKYRVGSANPNLNAKFIDPLSQSQALYEVSQGFSSDEDIEKYARRMIDDYETFRQAGHLAKSGRKQTIVEKGRARLIKKLLRVYNEEAFEQLKAFVDSSDSTPENRVIAQAYRASLALRRLPPTGANFPADPSADTVISRRAARKIDEASEGVTQASVASSNYKKFKKKLDDGDFQDLFRNKLIRKTAVGIGALVAGSFLYQSFTDRTPEDVQGPPLLPGGSAYEEYPIRNPSIPNVDMGSYNSSMSYNISVNGNQQKIREFNERAAALTNGNTSTTIYNNLPRSRRDPYSEMGQRY